MSQEFLKELISPGEKSNISFEESLLWKYSELARLSYEDGDIPGYADLVVDEHDRIIGKKDGQEVWVGFRGSGADSAHWLGNTGNLHALPNNDSVCQGFANAMQKFHDSLKSWCQGSRIIHLTGHSRGGAFATLEGWHLANDFEDAEVNVVVFGCPKVGTSTFAEKFRNQTNLRWAGFQHAGDHVGKLPPWGQHVHLPADPLTDFQGDSSSLLQTIPIVGNALNVMWVFGSNLMKHHSMESYHQSLKCNFILRTGAPDVDELINIITDEKQKAMLTIGVQAAKASADQVKHATNELKELLDADRLKDIISEALLRKFLTELAGTTSFLADMYSMDIDGMKKKVHDLEEKLHILVKQEVAEDATKMLKLLLEAFFKGGFVLMMCRMKLGDCPCDLKKRFTGLVKDVQKYLWRLARNLQDTDNFYASLPSLVQLEAAFAAHLNSREPLFVSDEIQDELLPYEQKPTKIQQEARKFKKELKSQLASEGPGGAAKILSSKGMGGNFVRLLEAILGDVLSDSEDERLKRCREEIEMLQRSMDDLLLPEVVLTGPTKAGKSSLANALLGQEVASTSAAPDSFLPIRFIPQGGRKFHVELHGEGLRDHPDLFKDKIDEELKAVLEAREVNTAEEVHEAIKKMNKGLRKFLDSEIFAQKFSAEETHVLSQCLCAGWSVDIKIPLCSPEALPVILVDLPGSTEGGLIGEFIKTMVRGSCIRASTALLVLGWEMIAELYRDGADPMQRFFGGASNFSGYYMVITKVFEKDTLDEIKPAVCTKAAQLKPEPLGIRFINSYLLRAHAASLAGSLPETFPCVETDASDEERCRCEGEQHRCQIIFRGVENRLMQKRDQKKFNGKDLQEELEQKLGEFPETAGFTSELFRSVDQRFPELFLGPHLKAIQRHIEQLVDEIHQRVEICSGGELQRKAQIDACRGLLSNLEVELMEPFREKVKAMLRIQGRIENMAEFDLPGRCNEETEGFYKDVSETFSPEVCDWCRRNVGGVSSRWRNCKLFYDVIKSAAVRESAMVYEQILLEDMAAKFSIIGLRPTTEPPGASLAHLSAIGDRLKRDFRHGFWFTFAISGALGVGRVVLEKAGFAAAAAAAGVSSTVASLVLPFVLFFIVPRVSNSAVAVETADERLQSLKECVALGLERLSNMSKDWIQNKVEERLRMLEEEPNSADLPRLVAEYEKGSRVLADLEEIYSWVKKDGGVDVEGSRVF